MNAAASNPTNPDKYRSFWIWPGITTGVAAAVAMWLVWYVLHLPGLNTPLAVTGLATGLTLVAGSAFLLRPTAHDAGAPIRAGALGGLVAGAIGLMLLGSKITSPTPDGTALNPDAPFVVVSFLLSTTVLGTVGGLLAPRLKTGMGARAGDAEPRAVWLRRLAIATAASYATLITVGGFVTSSGSGMAVPDWPGTYGTNMFLYPFALMEDPRIFYEHTHRLLGTLAGLATIILLLGSFAMRGSTIVRVLAGVLLAGVITQGVLGGLRVKEINAAYGAVHGVLGQALLVLAAMTAVFIGRAGATDDQTARAAKPVMVLGYVALVCLAIQLTFGSLYRHLGSTHALWSHIGFSIIVTGAVAHVALFSFRANKDVAAGKRLIQLAPAILAVLAVQFTMGFAAWGFGSGYGDDRPIPTAEELAAAPPINVLGSIVATFHQANGAALAALTGIALALAIRARQRAPRPATDRTPATPAGSIATPDAASVA